MALLYYLSYLAFFSAFAFVTLSLASGLLYVSELIEEHSRLAKTVGEKGIYVVIALHVLLCLADSLPLAHVGFSIICHLVYLQNFSNTWPLISLTSVSFIASCILVIADHFLWFFHFSRLANYNNHARTFRETGGQYSYGFGEIATFFALCVWLVPLFLFLSLSANDNALPVSSADPATTTLSKQQPAPPRGSLFRSIISDALPGVLSKKRRGTGEGLIAPHSPKATPSSIPGSPSFTTPRFSSPNPPSPRIPGSGSQPNINSHMSSSTSFQLGTPPRRASNSVRRHAGDPLGLGLKPDPPLSTALPST